MRAKKYLGNLLGISSPPMATVAKVQNVAGGVVGVG